MPFTCLCIRWSSSFFIAGSGAKLTEFAVLVRARLAAFSELACAVLTEFANASSGLTGNLQKQLQ